MEIVQTCLIQLGEPLIEEYYLSGGRREVRDSKRKVRVGGLGGVQHAVVDLKLEGDMHKRRWVPCRS